VARDVKDVFPDDLAAAGFIKTGSDARPQMSGQQRSLLIRKGNEFFNNGKIAEAKRIFLTTHYTDGIIRLGDYYKKQNKPLEAFRMYWLAPERHKSEYMIEQMAGVVREWLRQDEDATGG
jgi:hypothetical protein